MHHSKSSAEKYCKTVFGIQKKMRSCYKYLSFIMKPMTLFIVKSFVKKMYNEVKNVIDTTDWYKNLPKNKKSKLVNDIIICSVFYGFLPGEYASFRFDEKNEEERLEYYTVIEMITLYSQTACHETFMLFNNKGILFEKIKPFAKRDGIYIKNDTTMSECEEFLKTNRNVIVKPIEGYGGFGIRHITVEEGQESAVAETIVGKGEFLLEEYINQSEKMSWLNESSVNTVRICSFRMKDIVRIVYVALRVGRAGSFVDNASSGGLFIDVDTDTHKTLPKCSIGNNVYDKVIHPDSGKDLSDFEIPDWDNFMQIIIQAYNVLPEDAYYLGWDFAYTDNGWEIIEVNILPGSNQELRGGQAKELRELFKPYMKKIGC